jgi:hypothetical protein
MIKGIYLDNDETLSHALFYDPEQNHLEINLSEEKLYTIVRPCAQRIIDFCRELVGKENVFILTTATTEYIRAVNEAAGWEFPDEQIFAREDQAKYMYNGAYDGTQYIDSPQVHVNNVLIDNLPPKYNENKIAFLGIWRTWEKNYLQVRDYYGVDYTDDSFEDTVKEFLISRHSMCNDTGEEKSLEV